jgi:hypothetical protein
VEPLRKYQIAAVHGSLKRQAVEARGGHDLAGFLEAERKAVG